MISSMKKQNQELNPVRILIVDDHAIVRSGLRNLIGDYPGLQVVEEATTCEEAMKMAMRSQPDVIILDLRLPDGMGFEIIEDLKKAVTGTRVLVLTSYADDHLLITALKNGADGYLKKDITEQALAETMLTIARSRVSTPILKHNTLEKPETPSSWTQLHPLEDSTAKHKFLNHLTGQEQRVFELVGRGLTNRQVAQKLNLSEKTVRNYLARVFEKLGVKRRSEIVALFFSMRS